MRSAREKKIAAKMAKNGLHPDTKRLREFIKMVDDTVNDSKELNKERQREEARKVLGVLN
jgi:pyocin large subunit-like protein